MRKEEKGESQGARMGLAIGDEGLVQGCLTRNFRKRLFHERKGWEKGEGGDEVQTRPQQPEREQLAKTAKLSSTHNTNTTRLPFFSLSRLVRGAKAPNTIHAWWIVSTRLYVTTKNGSGFSGFFHFYFNNTRDFGGMCNTRTLG